MSRIGKVPISIPDGVTVTMNDRQIDVTGPKGQLTLTVNVHVQPKMVDNQVVINVTDGNDQADRALWGLTRVLVANMIIGVTKGFSKQLEINGVGYKAAASGQKVTLNLGYSHPIDYDVPAGISVTVEKNVVTVSGIDKQLVGEVAAKIRSFRKPEPYKGKGIKYTTETIRRKAGKVVKAAGAK